MWFLLRHGVPPYSPMNSSGCRSMPLMLARLSIFRPRTSPNGAAAQTDLSLPPFDWLPMHPKSVDSASTASFRFIPSSSWHRRSHSRFAGPSCSGWNHVMEGSIRRGRDLWRYRNIDVSCGRSDTASMRARESHTSSVSQDWQRRGG